jgi:hypothetical protein
MGICRKSFSAIVPYPIPNRRDAERAFTAPRLRDQNPPHRCRSIGLLGQILPQVCQPLHAARLLDRLEGHPVHTRCSPVGTGLHVGVFENVDQEGNAVIGSLLLIGCSRQVVTGLSREPQAFSRILPVARPAPYQPTGDTA